MKLDAEFHRRAKVAVETLMGQRELLAAVRGGVEDFFAAHPALVRTAETEGMVASLLIEKFSSAADSQSAAGTSEEPKKQVA